eukprot:CAMPEP_0116561936 /NCGR_PEP_ID=MMETSP0397-20121206/11869_1 /TAXON_ID=216820 /ORGANISM="Cyclophora tenuis, Strain ECT3854" /LENGTH=199 /DNA_ID=CAMNT_0004088153 /DNA_START=125 /DNA_END=724 /DNA_ORIENTATION=-
MSPVPSTVVTSEWSLASTPPPPGFEPWSVLKGLKADNSLEMLRMKTNDGGDVHGAPDDALAALPTLPTLWDPAKDLEIDFGLLDNKSPGDDKKSSFHSNRLPVFEKIAKNRNRDGTSKIVGFVGFHRFGRMNENEDDSTDEDDEEMSTEGEIEGVEFVQESYSIMSDLSSDVGDEEDDFRDELHLNVPMVFDFDGQLEI